MSNLKLLVAITSYGTGGDQHLWHLIEEYRSMSFDSHIVVFSNVKKNVPTGVELKVGLPTKNPWSLPWAHKQVFGERVNNYDLFIYSENDTLVTQKNIEAFLSVSEALPETEIPGFLRYENGLNGTRSYINLHGHYHWDPASVCKRGKYTFAFLTNEHSACYLLTRKQLQQAVDSGRYLVRPRQSKYDLACTASTDPYTVCGFRKLICVSHLEDFLVHHLPDKYTGQDFQASDQGFDKQVRALMTIGSAGAKPVSLLRTETRLPAALYSKRRDEEVQEEMFNFLGRSVQRILSVGSGWGKAERWLEKKGLQVSSLPLDPVVGACLEGSGVEVVYGDFYMAREKLEGRKFDCLFVSNVLHLVPDPEAILRMFAQLLDPGGYILLVTPNLTAGKNKLRGLLNKPSHQELQSFDQGGVQYLSIRKVRKWFTASEVVIKNVKWTASPRFQKLVQYGGGLFGSVFGNEMVVLGRKKLSRNSQKPPQKHRLTLNKHRSRLVAPKLPSRTTRSGSASTHVA